MNSQDMAANDFVGAGKVEYEGKYIRPLFNYLDLHAEVIKVADVDLKEKGGVKPPENLKHL